MLKRILLRASCTLVLMSAFSGVSIAGTSKTCVLIMDRKQNPFTRLAHETFDSAVARGQALVVEEAVPAQMLRCVDWGAEEMIVIAHANKPNAGLSSLFYAKEIPDSQRDAAVAKTLKALRSGDAPARSQRERDARIEALENADSDESLYYSPKPVLPVAFEALAAKLASERARRGEIRLKRIRISACHPDAVRNRYAREFALLAGDSVGAQVEFAPVNYVASVLAGVNGGVSLSRNWLLH